MCKSRKEKGKHIISTTIEHNAVRKTLAYMEKEGFEVTYLNPDERGQISKEQLEGAIRPDTILVTIMLVNNVVGTMLNIRELGVDFLSLSAHKFNGPKGVGALFRRLPNRLKPLLAGGGTVA